MRKYRFLLLLSIALACLAASGKLWESRYYWTISAIPTALILAAIVLGIPSGLCLALHCVGPLVKVVKATRDRVGRPSIIWLGVIAFVAAGLYPPWYSKVASLAPRDLGYRILFSPPAVAPGSDHTGRVDFDRLVVEWAIIAVVTGALLLSFASGKEKPSNPPHA